MATLEKIRNRAGILVAVVIGLALLAFILGDFLNSGGALFSNSQFEIAEIAGKSIPFQKYQKELNEITEINKFSSGQNALDEATTERIQEQTWNQLVREYTLEDEYKKLCIDISSQELWDMVQGENIHPIIQNLFTNPETGELNTVAVIRFLKTYDQDPTGQQKAYWLFVEDQMVQERAFSKYNNLIQKGLYSTKAEAQNEISFINKKVDINFVYQNINTIPDSLISVSNSDLKAYYNNHLNDYEQTASRTIEYITFDVVPSKEDKLAAENWINGIKPDFEQADNNADFVNLNGDFSFDKNFYKKDELPENLQDVMFNEREGYIYGPYFEDETFLLAKLAEVKYLPDSVKARHILLQPTQNQDYNQLFTIADSLKSLLEKGANFESISNAYSVDKAANEKGGDLGWFRANEMVAPFSDTCFNANTGEFKLAATQYGLHIVQVTNKSRSEKKVQVAILARKIQASTKTFQNKYAEASKFVGTHNTYDEFIKAIEEQGLTKKVAPNIKENDRQLASLENPRELIRSVYDTKEKELIKSQNKAIFELGDRYLIGFVTEIKEQGIAPFEQVKAQILVQTKKDKKAELIAEKFNKALNENKDLNYVADQLNTQVYEANDITFRSYTVPNVGIEPKLVAVSTALNENEISEPVKGNNAVFVAQAKAVSVDETINVELQQLQTLTQLKNRASYEAFEALKKESNIIDKRAKFY